MAVGIALSVIIIYFAFEVLMIKNKMNINWGLILMAVIMMALVSIAFPGHIGFQDWIALCSQGAFTYSGMIITFILYGVFGATLYEGGIITALIIWALKISSKSGVLVMLLAFYAAAFVAALGGGTFVVIMLGASLLLALGVPKKWAAIISVMPTASSYLLTVPIYSTIEATTGITQQELLPYAAAISIAATLCHIIVIIGFVKTHYLEPDQERLNALLTENKGRKVYKITFLLPLVPVVMILGLGLNSTFTFIVSSAITMLVSQIGQKTTLEEISASAARAFKKGAGDAGNLAGLMICIGILVQAVNTPAVKECFVAFFMMVIPESKLGIMILFGLLGVFGTSFRGIGGTTGMGISIMLAMLSMPQFTPFQVACFWAALAFPGVAIDPLAGNAVIGCEYAGGISNSEYLGISLPVNALPTLIGIAAVVFGAL